MAPSPSSILACTSPKGVVSLALAGWTSLPNTVGLVHKPKSSETVPPWYPGRGTSGLKVVGIPSGRCTWGLEVPNSCSWHLGLHSSLWGAQRRPLSSRQAPRSHLFLGSPLTPTTNQVCWLYIPSTWSNLCSLLLGVLEKDHSLCPPLACQPAIAGSTWGLAPAPVRASDQDQWRPVQVLVLLSDVIPGSRKVTHQWEPVRLSGEDQYWWPSSGRALLHLWLHPWDLLLGQSWLWEWWQTSSHILLVDWLSLSMHPCSVAAATRACQWASLVPANSCSSEVSCLPLCEAQL